MTGTSGQNLRISGYHMALQFLRDIGLAMEKHSNTTSDLKIYIIYDQYSLVLNQMLIKNNNY